MAIESKKNFGNFQSRLSLSVAVYFQIKSVFCHFVIKSLQIRKLLFGKLKSCCVSFLTTLPNFLFCVICSFSGKNFTLDLRHVAGIYWLLLLATFCSINRSKFDPNNSLLHCWQNNNFLLKYSAGYRKKRKTRK